MQSVSLVVRVDAGAVNITPELVEEAINFYIGSDGAVSVFHAAQQSVHLTGGGLCVCDVDPSVNRIDGVCLLCGLPRK
ncbi:MAG: hypothetical protein EHM40_03015 [Chloroflexi bacterium]|nr:MAG: hypothetical protein EHM40_03015 [Chloroflexota bacterium]